MALRTAKPIPRILPEQAKILIIRFSALGDVIRTTALPRQLKRQFPSARVVMLTAAEYVPLFADNPHLADVWGVQRRETGFFQLLAKLRGEEWDLLLDVHGSLRSRLLCGGLMCFRSWRRLWGSSAPLRWVTYPKRSLARGLLLAFRLPMRSFCAKDEDFLAPLAPWGLRGDGRGPELFLDRAEAALCKTGEKATLLAQVARWQEEGRTILGLAPGARWPLKRWPLQAWQELIARGQQRFGLAWLIFGGREDRALGELLGVGPKDGLNLAGMLDLPQTACFARFCRVVVANDSAMLHLAEAAGVPVVGLFGPTGPQWGYYPGAAAGLALDLPLVCRPCTRTGAGSCTHPWPQACLAGLEPARVLAALERWLGRPGGGPPEGGGEKTLPGFGGAGPGQKDAPGPAEGAKAPGERGRRNGGEDTGLMPDQESQLAPEACNPGFPAPLTGEFR